MKKTLLSGLAVVILSCSQPEPVTPSSTPRIHRGVPVTGIIYRDIQIIGPEDYTERMKNSLDRLHQTPFWSFVHQHITTIRLNPPSCVHVAQGIYDSDDNLTTPQKYQPEAWIDSEIGHEACHVYRYKKGKTYSGYEAEKECIEWQNKYFNHVGATDLLIDVEKMLAQRHWEIEDRWW